MSRRKHLAVRKPCGRLYPARDRDLLSPTEVRRLVDAAADGLRDQVWGPSSGGCISTARSALAQFAAAKRWAEMVANYSIACRSPSPPRTFSFDTPGGTPIDPDTETGEREVASPRARQRGLSRGPQRASPRRSRGRARGRACLRPRLRAGRFLRAQCLACRTGGTCGAVGGEEKSKRTLVHLLSVESAMIDQIFACSSIFNFNALSAGLRAEARAAAGRSAGIRIRRGRGCVAFLRHYGSILDEAIWSIPVPSWIS